MAVVVATNKAHKTFKRTIARSINLLRAFRVTRLRFGERQLRQPDILRASIVLTVAGMDAYFTSRFVDAATKTLQQGKGLSQSFIDVLKAAKVDERYLLSILGNDRPIRSIRNNLDRHVSLQVTQSFRAIDRFYQTLGLKDLSKNACKKSGKARLYKGVERAVNRRHEIVHDGDYNKNGTLRKIKADYVERHVRYIEQFVDCSEEIIDNFINALQ